MHFGGGLRVVSVRANRYRDTHGRESAAAHQPAAPKP